MNLTNPTESLRDPNGDVVSSDREDTAADQGVTHGGKGRRSTTMTSVVPSRKARQRSGSVMYRRRKTHEYRTLVVTDTGISNYALERAQQRGLVLAIEDSDDELDEIERSRQVKIIRGMAIPMDSKRKLRFGPLFSIV